MRLPTPNLPPVHPVLTSQQSTWWLLDDVAQQIAVDGRMQRQERRAEAGRERRLRLGHALLGARHLGRVAGQKMIHRLRWIEFGDRRQHAEGVAGQHDDVLGMAGAPCRRGVGDELERIGDAGVLGLRTRRRNRACATPDPASRSPSPCRNARSSHRSPAPPRAKPDRLGVAAALEIEDAVAAPAMLVVADQHAVRVGRQRRLAGAGEAEEDRHVAVLADVGRAMHRHDAAAPASM